MVAVSTKSAAFGSARADVAPPSPLGSPRPSLAGHGPPRCLPCPLRRPSPLSGKGAVPRGAERTRRRSGVCPMEVVGCSAPVLRRPPLRGHGRPCRLAHGRKRRPPPARRIRGNAPPSRERPPFRGDAGRPRRRQGRRGGRQSQVTQYVPHDLGIREEREHDHRNGSRGRRAPGTLEAFYMQHAAKKLLPGEPSSRA
jgi:hypothetical protein